MKKTTAILTALLVMAVLFASCSNGMGEKAEGSAAGTSSQKVMVSLGVDVEGEYIQKDVSVDDFDLSGLTVWYKATHKWSQNRNVSGDTAGMGDANDFVQIPNFTSGELVNLGSFTAGIWDFFVEVRKGSDPVYTGRVENYQLYTGHAAIEITVAPITGTGTVAISVQVPTTGANEKLYMTYTGLGSSIALKRGSVTSNITTFFYDIDDDGTYEPTGDDQLSLAGGAYTFTFLYYDQSIVPASNPPTPAAQNGGASVAVNVVAGEDATISGLIENGKWHPTSLTITVPGVTCVVAPTDGEAHPYLAPDTGLSYTCTATSANTPTYAWFVNGVDKSNATSTFTFSESDYGLYEITCVVTDGDARAFSRQWVEVTNTITVETANVTSNKAHATNGEIVTLKPASGYHFTAVPTVTPTSGVAPTAYPVVGGYAFHMPAKAVTITATVAAD